MTDHDLLGDNISGFANHQLVAARESLGLTPGALQRELKLTSAVFAAIESGDLASIGQPVFARGYIRNYCNRVGLDPELFIEQYNAYAGIKPVKRSSKLRAAGSMAGGAALKLNPRRSSSILSFLFRILIILLLVSGVAFAVMQINVSSFGLGGLFDLSNKASQDQTSELPPPMGEDNGLAIPVVPLKPSVNNEESVIGEQDAPQGEALGSSIALDEPSDTPDDAIKVVSVPRNVDSTSQRVDESEPNTVNDSLAVNYSSAVTVSEEAQNTEAEVVAQESLSNDGLVITFSDVSWLNIKDASGEALFNGLSEAGQTLNIEGDSPLSVVIGRSNAVTNVTFNGVAVDLEPHTRKNVTRLTLSR